MWRFLVGAEAAGSVLATALYQNLGAGEEDGGEDDDPLSPKLLVFSDSRQDAAFFAPYPVSYTHLFAFRWYMPVTWAQKLIIPTFAALPIMSVLS